MRLSVRPALRNGTRALARYGAAIAILVGAVLIGGCSTSRGGTPSGPPPDDKKTTEAKAGQQAALRAIGGSAVSGKIRVIDRGDGATILVSVIGIPSISYRIALHRTPNCSSPNGFSAGPAWAPSSFAKSPQDLVSTQYVTSDGIAASELRIAGLHATGVNGVAGRSVVLYAGQNVTEARPDVPNAAIACGVFQPAQPFAF